MIPLLIHRLPPLRLPLRLPRLLPRRFARVLGFGRPRGGGQLGQRGGRGDGVQCRKRGRRSLRHRPISQRFAAAAAAAHGRHVVRHQGRVEREAGAAQQRQRVEQQPVGRAAVEFRGAGAIVGFVLVALYYPIFMLPSAMMKGG